MKLISDSINGAGLKLIYVSSALSLPDKQKGIKSELQRVLKFNQHRYLLIDSEAYIYRTSSSSGVSFAQALETQLKSCHFSDGIIPTNYLVVIPMDRFVYLCSIDDGRAENEQVLSVEEASRILRDLKDRSAYVVLTNGSCQEQLLNAVELKEIKDYQLNIKDSSLYFTSLNASLWALGIRLPRLINCSFLGTAALLASFILVQFSGWFAPKVQQAAETVSAQVIPKVVINATPYLLAIATTIDRVDALIPHGVKRGNCKQESLELSGIYDRLYRPLYLLKKLQLLGGQISMNPSSWNTSIPLTIIGNEIDTPTMEYADIANKIQQLADSLYFSSDIVLTKKGAYSINIKQDFVKVKELRQLAKYLNNFPLQLTSCGFSVAQSLIRDFNIHFNLVKL